MGRECERRARSAARGGARAKWSHAHVCRAGGVSAHAADAREGTGAREECSRTAVARQEDAVDRSRAHDHRHSQVRRRHRAARDEVRGAGSATSVGRQSRVGGRPCCAACAGRGARGAHARTADSRRLRAVGGCGGDCEEHVGRHQGARRAGHHVGQRIERELRLQSVQGRAASGSAIGRKAGSYHWQRGRRAGVGESQALGCVLHAALVARANGTHGGDRAGDQWRRGSMGANAVATGRARSDRGVSQSRCREGHRACDAIGRWFRAQIKTRLHVRSGVAGPRGWSARARAVDARGRSAAQLLPQCRGAPPRSGVRCARQGGGVASSLGVPIDLRHLRAKCHGRLTGWAH